MIFKKLKRIARKENLKTEEKQLQSKRWQMRLLSSYPAPPSAQLHQDFIVHQDLLKVSSKKWVYLKRKKDGTITYQKNAWQLHSKKER